MELSAFEHLFTKISENKRLLIFSVIVGLATGFGVRLFRLGIVFFQTTYRDSLIQTFSATLGPWAIIPILALAGFIVNLIAIKFIGPERHHGVAGIIESTALNEGKLPYQRMPLKTLLSSFSLGAGASVGPEDPSVQVGSNIGSMLGHGLHLSEERINLLVASGAAAGIAAAFQAPISGVFFALEAILGDFSTRSFGVVVLASVVSTITTKFLSVDAPSLGIRNYGLTGLPEIPFFIILGLICAPIAAVFIKSLYWQHDFWHHFSLPRPVKGALAGAIIGLMALAFPQIMGTGHETMGQLLNQDTMQFGIAFLLGLAAMKLIATTISLGGGFIGGMFAPSLFVGAAVGAAFGQALPLLTGGLIPAHPAVFAMAGMAAMMTGVIRTPITSVLLLFELTDDYRLIIPIMLITSVTLFIVEKMAPMGIYEHGLSRAGLNLLKGKTIDLMGVVKVWEVMETKVYTVPESLPLEELSHSFIQSHQHGIVVVDANNNLAGIVSLADITKAKKDHQFSHATVKDICTKKVITISKDATIAQALKLMNQYNISRLPVPDISDKKKIIGVLRRRDIISSYEIAIRRKQESVEKEYQLRLAIQES